VIEPHTLDRMTDAMTHRGPDDRGTFLEKGVAFGVRRLSIVDVEAGHQPFSNEDGRIWAVQNGELFNHEDLRRSMGAAGHRFATRCDTEIIPHLYEEHGVEFERELRGMFGIAVWDDDARRAVLVRDRLGIKPLYYAQVGDLLVFASELKSLLASGLVPTDLDYEAIDAYLGLGFFPAPATPLASVRKLPPGHRIVVERGGVRVERYWTYPVPAPRQMSRDEAAERLMAELEEAVRLRLMSDVPLGAMLSGGLDSSIVVALMARQMSEPVKTFAVGFSGAQSANELDDARYVASVFGADHHELELSFADADVDLAELVWHLDEPVADLSSLGFLALSELARRHVTVALSGQGADELLGGYRKHRAAALAGAWRRLPAVVRRPAGKLFLEHGPLAGSRAARALTATDSASRLVHMSGAVGPALRERLVRGQLASRDGGAALRAVQRHLNGVSADPLSETLYLDAQLGLPDDMLHYFDRASMAHSLEVRVPFLDHHVVEYCATIPRNLKVHRLETKHVLKHAARGLVPDRIIDKGKIGFFNSAVQEWFRAQTDGAVGAFLLDERPAYADMIDRGVVAELAHRHAREDGGRLEYPLLAILMLEVWLSTFLPRAAAPQAVPAAAASR
jgi:asparagine synthase (glutamine-hydrolysing)